MIIKFKEDKQNEVHQKSYKKKIRFMETAILLIEIIVTIVMLILTGIMIGFKEATLASYCVIATAIWIWMLAVTINERRNNM